MTGDAHQKVNAGHLKRNAHLYIRQSTLRQVFENTESTKLNPAQILRGPIFLPCKDTVNNMRIGNLTPETFAIGAEREVQVGSKGSHLLLVGSGNVLFGYQLI